MLNKLKLISCRFRIKLMKINKSPGRIKIDARGRNKNPVAKIFRTPKYKSKIKPSGKLYSRKKNTLK